MIEKGEQPPIDSPIDRSDSTEISLVESFRLSIRELATEKTKNKDSPIVQSGTWPLKNNRFLVAEVIHFASELPSNIDRSIFPDYLLAVRIYDASAKLIESISLAEEGDDSLIINQSDDGASGTYDRREIDAHIESFCEQYNIYEILKTARHQPQDPLTVPMSVRDRPQRNM